MNEKNRTITLGDKDFAIVKRIQIRLNLMGVGPITEDGDFGMQTLQAVKAFQLSHLDINGNPLIIDGKVGPMTWTSLFDIPISQHIAAPPLLTEVLKNCREGDWR
jgi:peptidoglycan hydrolase-like protein with peptidoglycan-binding domain